MRPTPLTEQLDERLVGGKAAQLAVAVRAGLPVPAGIALPVVFVDAVAAGRDDARSELAEMPGALRRPLVARSSAVGEVSREASFAGQHLTRLNLRSLTELVDAVCAIWASARSPAALAYRERLGLSPEPAMAVVVQELVDAESSGVLFSGNPLDGSDELVIEAAWGLGEAVVAGLVKPDRFGWRRTAPSLSEPQEGRRRAHRPCRRHARDTRSRRARPRPLPRRLAARRPPRPRGPLRPGLRRDARPRMGVCGRASASPAAADAHSDPGAARGGEAMTAGGGMVPHGPVGGPDAPA